MDNKKCELCKHFRISDPLKKKICDFWERQLQEDEQVVGCNGYKEKEAE